MPIIKSAKKKLRQDAKRTKNNLQYKINIEKVLKNIKKNKDSKDLVELIKTGYSKIDKAVKRKIIHKKKASHLKSAIAKLIKKTK